MDALLYYFLRGLRVLGMMAMVAGLAMVLLGLHPLLLVGIGVLVFLTFIGFLSDL